MIHFKNKFVFVHIPRCGGTSVEKLFEDSLARELNEKDWEDYVDSHKELLDHFNSSRASGRKSIGGMEEGRVKWTNNPSKPATTKAEFGEMYYWHKGRHGGWPVPRISYDNFCHLWDEDNKLWRQHATMSQIHDICPEDLSEYFKFAFVRNPWDRLVSDWRWLGDEVPCLDSFKDFLLERGCFEESLTIKKDDKYRGDHVRPQCDFIFDESENQLVDFIGRFENLQKDFNTILKKINIPPQKLPHLAATVRKHYTEYYDDETRTIVANKYAKDIEKFKYEFGE